MRPDGLRFPTSKKRTLPALHWIIPWELSAGGLFWYRTLCGSFLFFLIRRKNCGNVLIGSAVHNPAWEVVGGNKGTQNLMLPICASLSLINPIGGGHGTTKINLLLRLNIMIQFPSSGDCILINYLGIKGVLTRQTNFPARK
jgi:hypothetical protein